MRTYRFRRSTPVASIECAKRRVYACVYMDKLEYSDLDADVINITPRNAGKRGGSLWWIAIPLVLFLIGVASSIGIYADALWFDSLGFSSRFWYVFGLGWVLFAVFAILTVVLVRGGFYIMGRIFGPDLLRPRRMFVNRQPVEFNFGRFVGPIAWIAAIVIGLGYGFGLSNDWQTWVLYLHQPASITATDPIFGNAVGFYLFTLPIYN